MDFFIKKSIVNCEKYFIYITLKIMNWLTRENILEKFLTYNGTRDIKKTDYRISIEFVEILKYYHRNNENIKDIYKEYSTWNIANDFISKIYLPLIKEGNLTEEEINNWIRKIGYTDFGSHSLSFIDRYTKWLLAWAWYFWNWTETFGTKEEITKNMWNAQYLGWNLLFADLRGTFLNFIKESILPE